MNHPDDFAATDVNVAPALDFSVSSVRAVLLSHRYSSGQELQWVGGTIRSWDAALIEVRFEDGQTGVGEVGAGIMAAVAVPGILQALTPYLIGEKFGSFSEVGAHLRARTAFWARGGIVSGVIGAIETACLDAVGKREGLPAYELLGGLRREAIEVYASGGLGSTFDDVVSWALRQADAGFSTVKFRAMRDPATTIALLHHVVPRLPGGTRFVLDAVQGSASSPWGVEEAVEVGAVAASYGARWFEEPCFADDVAGYAAVRSRLDVPVSGVESSGTVREFAELIGSGGIDIAQPDVTFVGGPIAFLEVASRAADAGLACVPHVWGSGVTFAANLHAALASPHVELFEFCTLPNPLREALLVEPIRFADGAVGAPLASGLGVRLTEQLEEDYPFEAGFGHVIR